MTLREKQSLFAVDAARLVLKATEIGYAVTLGETYRSKEEAERLASLGKGIKTSLHTQRLAIDLNLFRDGQYLTDGDDYQPLGEWWEAQSFDGAEHCWGGRFKDGNHFSIAHNGRK